MTDRSGCGLTELAALETVGMATTDRPRTWLPSVKAAAGIEARIGLGPRYGYEVLVDLARPWIIPVPLVVMIGSIGDRSFPEASAPVHTECRLSQVGELVLDVEGGRLAPIPVGIINGTIYRGGSEPPLEPSRVLAGIRRLIEDPRAADSELLAIVGTPYSVTGCSWTGDLEGLMKGRRVVLRETGKVTLTGIPVPAAQVTPPRPLGLPEGDLIPVGAVGIESSLPDGPGHLVVESLPGRTSTAQAYGAIEESGWPSQSRDRDTGQWIDRTVPIAGVADQSSRHKEVCIQIELKPGADPSVVRDQIAALEGITVEMTCAFPARLARVLRTWVDRHRGEDISASLDMLDEAIRHNWQRRRAH